MLAMRRLCLVAAATLSICGPLDAQTVVRPSMTQGLLCRSAVAAAERAAGIPAHLLAAINRVESGRRDPVTGAIHPWPWTVNTGGEGNFYDTKVQAIAAVRALQARGVQSIDVGCGQINLMHHPNAFPNLEVAFDPVANASYAARFLRELFVQTGDWTRAAALYHSATPELGAEYRQRVLAVLPEEQRFGCFGGMTPLAVAWAATLTTAPRGFAGIPRGQLPAAIPSAQMIALPGVAGWAITARGLANYRVRPSGFAVRSMPYRIGG